MIKIRLPYQSPLKKKTLFRPLLSMSETRKKLSIFFITLLRRYQTESVLHEIINSNLKELYKMVKCFENFSSLI